MDMIAFFGALLSGVLLTAPPPTDTGLASFYAEKFAGRKTSSGERYDPAKLTAAHRTHPFGTMLRVTRLDNGDSIVVRVNDRGPFRKNRVVDLSRRAARELGMISAGLARVRVDVLPLDMPATSIPLDTLVDPAIVQWPGSDHSPSEESPSVNE